MAEDLAASAARAATDPLTLFGTMNVPDSDRTVMERIAPHIAAGHLEAARQGAAGYIDDLVAFTQSWGIDLAEASAPVVIEYNVAVAVRDDGGCGPDLLLLHGMERTITDG